MRIPEGLEIPVATFFLIVGSAITVLLAISKKVSDKKNKEWDEMLEDIENGKKKKTTS